MRRKIAVAIAAIGTLALAACGSTETETEAVGPVDNIDALYEAAKEEGEVIVYGPTEDIYRPVYEEFQKAYPGIEVIGVDIFGPELDSRLQGEMIAGGFEADLLHIGVSDMTRYAAAGYLAGFRPVEAHGLADEFRGPDDSWSVPSQHLYATLYNTEKLTAEKVPAEWADLVDEKWSGIMASSDPAVSGATPQVLSAALDAGVIDEAWVKTLASTVKPKIFPSVSTSLQATTTGETGLSLVAGYGTFMRKQGAGAPLGFVVMKDGGYMSDVAYGVLNDGPHPDAARLLVNWMFTPEGQAAIAEHVFEFGTMPDAPQPAGADDLGDFERITYPGPKRYKETLELLGEHF